MHFIKTLCLLGAWLTTAAASFGTSLEGVVVEEVTAGYALDQAGIRPGDVVLSWRRAAEPPGRPGVARGRLTSVFDWGWLILEQAPRGTVELSVRRGGEVEILAVAPGSWESKVRPRMPASFLELYRQGRERLAAGNLDGAADRWSRIVETNEPGADWRLCSFLLLRTGELQAEARAWEQAETVLRSALDEARDPLSRAAVYRALGKVYEKQSDFERARQTYTALLELRTRAGEESLALAATFRDLGVVASNQGQLDLAQEHLERALEICRRLAPDSLPLAAVLNNLGSLAGVRGDLGRAGEYFERALAIWQDLVPGSLAVASGWNNLGAVARFRGELEQAIDDHEKALGIRQQLAPDSLDMAASLTNLGAVAFEKGDLDAAAEYFERALVIQERLSPGGNHLAVNLNNLGTVANQRGEPERAIGYYERALAIRQRLAPDSLEVAETLRNLAYLHDERGDLDRAAESFARALAIQERLAPDSFHAANTLYGLGGLHRRQAEPGVAIDFLHRAIDVLENQIGKLGGSHGTHADFRARYRDIYREALELELDLEQPERAFHTLERSRARVFLALLAEREALFAAEVPAELDDTRRRLAARYDRYQKQIAQLHPREDSARIEDLHRQLRQLRGEADGIARQIRQASPRLAALRYPEPLEIGAARAALDPGTLMLSYSVGKERTHLFVVAPAAALRVETLEIGEDELRREVELFQKLIPQAIPGDPFGDAALVKLRELGQRLYSRLIQPAAAHIAASERLLIVPDGPLHLLAFAALSRRTEAGEARYLVEWKPLHSALSATVYAELKKSKRRDGEPRVLLAAFGDPRYPERREDLPIADEGVRSAVERGLFDWNVLPYTRQEVERIAELYPSRTVQVHLGPEATEERVKSLGPAARILHIAAHGYLDERFPLDSFVALSIPNDSSPLKSPQGDNGLLQAWEIFEQVRLDADLVVLSACRSGGGKELGGEGLIGLTRAFQYAGARSVAAALWSVPDQSTAELMVRFYRHLRAGKSKDIALQTAQQELIRGPIAMADQSGLAADKDASAPYYWAAFQIYGDWQ